jgi:spermidine synthase
MVTFYVYLSVVIGGAAVLAVELLGTRVLAPFYGASLYLWSALISVTLAALSVGYALGGRWADRGPTLRRLASVIGIAGVWIAMTPWLRLPVLSVSESAGLRVAVLITAALLFFPPLMLLGIVSPYAIRLRAASLDTVGRTAGNLYSISTIASVVAALATGFVLIPNIGVSRLLFEIGFILVATGIFGLVIAQRPRIAVVTAIALAILGIVAYRLAPVETADPARGLVAIEQSAYGEIRVVDQDDLRFLVLDGGTHTVVDTATWQSHFPYVNVLDIPKGFFETPGRMLLIGLGGGSVAKSFSRDGWRVDAVEIDPEVEAVARARFGLTDKDAAVHVMDARQFLITNHDQYDLIVLDAFSSEIPFHLVTTESFELVRSHLAPGGVVAMNVESVGWDDILVRSLSATITQLFAHVTVYPIAEPPDHLGNVVLMASNRVMELKDEPPVPKDRFSPEYDRAHAWENRFDARPAGAPVLTDDLNPVDIWAERVNYVARKELHSLFKERGLAW